MDVKSQEEFEAMLPEGFIRKGWRNYPQSIFYYRPGATRLCDEIGIYTNKITWAIYGGKYAQHYYPRQLFRSIRTNRIG